MEKHTIALEEDQHYSKSLISKYLRYKKIYILSFLVFILLAVVYLWWATPLYRIQSSIMVKDEGEKRSLSLNLKELDFSTDLQSIENEIQIVRSNTVLENVVKKLQLNIGYYEKTSGLFYDPVFVNIPFTLELLHDDGLEKEALKIQTGNGNSFRLLNDGKAYQYNEPVRYKGLLFSLKKQPSANPKVERHFTVRISSIQQATETIKKALTIIAPSKNASLLHISILYPSQEKGETILTAVVDEYNKLNIQEKRNETDTLQNIIQNRLALLSEQLNNFEDREQHFKIANQITNLSEDSKVLLEKGKEADQNSYLANLQLEILNALENYVVTATGSLAPPNLGTNDPVLIDMVRNFNQLHMRRDALSVTTGPGSPQLNILNQQIESEKKSILRNIIIQKEAVLDNLRKLSAAERALKIKIRSIPVSERQLVSLFREKSVRENIYIFLLQKNEEASLSNVDALYKLRIIDRAYSSDKPVKPNKIIVFAISLVLGFLLPTVFINFKSTINSKVTSKEIIRSRIAHPIIAEITRMKNFHYLIYQDVVRITAEQLRLLRTRIEKNIPHSGSARKILITSATTDEGKTFVSLNLAISFALNERKALLIDLDLRNPDISDYLKTQKHKTLNDYFNNDQIEISEIISQHQTWPHLHTITSVKTNEALPELPMKKLDALFAYVESRFEYVVLNTPPFVVISDALQLEKFADITLFIIRHNYTDIRYLDLIKAAIQKNEYKNMHIVFNDVPVEEIYGKDIFKGDYL